MSIIKTEIQTIGEFLLNGNLQIPNFQRPYKWSVKNVIQLIDDLSRFKSDKPYRVGTIVIYKENEIFNIVDGQQRTVTFLLMIKGIMEINYQGLSSSILRSQLHTLSTNSFAPRFKNEISRKNIQNNYREIERRLANVDEAFIDFFLNKCEITYFVIDDISEAFQFFDSQNARGKDLEPHDLLKAFHLREISASNESISDSDLSMLVDSWENMDTKQLSILFADFLYRVRGWSKGNSSRYFSKEDTPLFKGINLSNGIGKYPYTQIFRMADNYIKETSGHSNDCFPFQLDQTIINGKYFFEMISHYKEIYDNINSKSLLLSNGAQTIMSTLNSYAGKDRTGDKYVRMLFNCSLLYYVDKFGETDLSKAIEKIFIWAYSIRLNYQNLQLASIDNYVLDNFNIFKEIRDAIYKEEIIELELPLIKDDYPSDKTREIKQLFIKMKYYANAE